MDKTMMTDIAEEKERMLMSMIQEIHRRLQALEGSDKKECPNSNSNKNKKEVKNKWKKEKQI